MKKYQRNITDDEKPDYVGPKRETLEKICAAHYAGGDTADVEFFDQYMHDACNYTLNGIVKEDGRKFGFIVDDGNMNGTVVRAWGDPEDVGYYHPPKVEPLTFIPEDQSLHKRSPARFAVYLKWRNEEWFQEKVGALNYDLHFCPTTEIRQHYADWARKRGLKIGLFSELDLTQE